MADKDQTHNDLGRGHLTELKRIELLEHDREQQSRMITEMVNKEKSFTKEQLAQIRGAFREELADAGLRVEEPHQQDEARRDFMFLRRLRQAWDGTAAKVGNAILMGVIVVAGVIISTGFWAWINNGGKP